MNFRGDVARPFEQEQASQRLMQARHLIVDLDGTLVREDEVLPGAARLLQQFEGRYVVVSNNSTHTRAGLARRMRRLGLRVDPEALVLAGEAALDHLAHNHPDARVFISGSEPLRLAAQARGIRCGRDDADVVLLALDTRFNFARLKHMANLLQRGATLIAVNPDANHPGPDDTLVPQTGALLAALETASGVRAHTVIGKPGAPLLLEGLRRLSASPAQCVLVGDNPHTDGKAAKALGIPCVLVGPHRLAHAPSLPALWAQAASDAPAPPMQPALSSA